MVSWKAEILEVKERKGGTGENILSVLSADGHNYMLSITLQVDEVGATDSRATHWESNAFWQELVANDKNTAFLSLMQRSRTDQQGR